MKAEISATATQLSLAVQIQLQSDATKVFIPRQRLQARKIFCIFSSPVSAESRTRFTVREFKLRSEK